jgi:hypothetical protein
VRVPHEVCGAKTFANNKGSNMRKLEMVTAGFIAIAAQSLVVAAAFI